MGTPQRQVTRSTTGIDSFLLVVLASADEPQIGVHISHRLFSASPPTTLTSLETSLQRITTRQHRNHGSYVLEAVRQTMGQEGDAHSDGWSRRRRKDDHPV